MTTVNKEPREWWIGRSDTGWDKWLTGKNPEDAVCRHCFICSDGEEKCAEIIAVIEKSTYDSVVAERDRYRKALDKIKEKHNEWIDKGHWCDSKKTLQSVVDTAKEALKAK